MSGEPVFIGIDMARDEGFEVRCWMRCRPDGVVVIERLLRVYTNRDRLKERDDDR